MRRYFVWFCFCCSLSILFSPMAYSSSLQSRGDALSNDMFIGAKRVKPKTRNVSDSSSSSSVKKSSSRQRAYSSQSKAIEHKARAPRSATIKNSHSTSSYQKDNTYSEEVFTNDYSCAEFGKEYASSLFRQYAGHITIEEENIPRRISVVRGSTIQFNLFESAGTFWNLDYNKDALKIVFEDKNKENRTVIFETIKDCSSKINFDYISTLNNDYKVLKHKTLLIKAD